MIRHSEAGKIATAPQLRPVLAGLVEWSARAPALGRALLTQPRDPHAGA